MMKHEPSDWHFPRDLLLILSLQFAILPIAIFAGLFLAALSAARHVGYPGLLYLGLALSIIGVVLLLFARLPLYRQHKFYSFGPRELPVGHRRLYWTAYGFIIASIAIMLFLLLAFK